MNYSLYSMSYLEENKAILHKKTSVRRWIHQRDWRDFQASLIMMKFFQYRKKISLNFVCCSSCSYVCYSQNEWMNSVTAKKVPLEVIIIISRCFKSLHNPLKKELKNVYWVVSWSVIGWLDFFKIHLFQNLHFWKIELVEKMRCNFH